MRQITLVARERVPDTGNSGVSRLDLAIWAGDVLADARTKKVKAALDATVESAERSVRNAFIRYLREAYINPDYPDAHPIASGDLANSLVFEKVGLSRKGSRRLFRFKVGSASEYYKYLETRNPADAKEGGFSEYPSFDRVALWLNQKFGLPIYSQRAKEVISITLPGGTPFIGSYSAFVKAVMFGIWDRIGAGLYDKLNMTGAINDALSRAYGKGGLVRRARDQMVRLFSFDPPSAVGGSDDIPF